MLSTISFDIDVLAKSSIIHREDYTSSGPDTFTLFRREKIISAEGRDVLVPMISGSSFRGTLRRIGEQLTASVLNYEGTLPIPAAHLLTNGGRLAKTNKPLSDEQERQLKDLIPQIGVFGGSASGRIMSGALAVERVVPEFDEVAHLLDRPTHGPTRPATLGMADEFYAHLNDHRPTTTQPPRADTDTKHTSPLGRFEIETLPAGTRLQTGARITDATRSQIGFLANVLAVFAERGHLGGRIADGHGKVTATINTRVERGPDFTWDELRQIDWASELSDQREQAIEALSNLT
ncbi:hypothetical protein BKG71_23455 [Mycobacteroides chelonae]|nr:hypothetical protein BKG71_23455 [Mycobacteroides chelonae]